MSRRNRSRVQERFSMIPRANIPRSAFDRSHGVKMSFNSSYLYPIFVDEVLPGDTFSLETSVFCRLATPLHPIMDNIHVETFFFFVPNRLVWDNWQFFCGEREDPADDPTTKSIPQISSGGSGYGTTSLYGYMGVNPTGGVTTCSALPGRAYYLIWNEWFRDQNLQDSKDFDTGDGPDVIQGGYKLLKRNKRHDYFTSCLPWPQKGTAVELPLGVSAPLAGTDPITGTVANTPKFDCDTVSSSPLRGLQVSGDVNLNAVPGSTSDLTWETTGLEVDLGTGTGYADLTSATAATVNELREAFQLQRMYERDARGGTRYVELLRSHFGVISPDQRVQRPEYLGGGRYQMNVVPVAQTSETSVDSPQANLAGFGIASGAGGRWTKSFVEHGIVIGVLNARSDMSYQQGLPRMWSREDREEFYWPALAHLGEQGVLNKEIYFSTGDGNNDNVFGYQERWAEYRYKPSICTGKMNSADANSLDTWHLGFDFDSRPSLNSDFIEEDPPIDRVIAVADEEEFIADVWHSFRCVRPMPVYSVPGLIDHF